MTHAPLYVDGNSLAKRCIMAAAIDDLKAGGIWTGGVYGTLTSLASFLRMPEARVNIGPVTAFFDSGSPVRKLKLLPSYKHARKERRKLLTEEEKAKALSQMDLVRQMLPLLGVRCLAYKDREADDCVAAAVAITRRDYPHYSPVVMTGDHDLWQCVPRARVWDLNKKRWIDGDNFDEVVGVPPETYTVYKALVGDPSDSIMGAKGVGRKRARTLILEACGAMSAFRTATPAHQLAMLVGWLKERTEGKKPRKFEQSVIESSDYLQVVLKVITVWTQFGSTKGLAVKLAEPSPPVQAMPFLRFCKKLHFQSVLGSPERYLRPFRTVWR